MKEAVIAEKNYVTCVSIFSMSSTTVFLMYILKKYPFPCTYIICLGKTPPPLRPEKKIKKNNLLSLPHAS